MQIQTLLHRVMMMMSTKLSRSHNQWMVLSSQTGTTPIQMNPKTDVFVPGKEEMATELQLRYLQNILTALLFQQFNIAFTSCEKHFFMKMTAIMHQIMDMSIILHVYPDISVKSST